MVEVDFGSFTAPWPMQKPDHCNALAADSCAPAPGVVPIDTLADLALRGQHVHLVPLSVDHHDELVTAVQDGELWNLWYTSVPDPAGMLQEIQRRLALRAQGSMLPFTVIDTRSGRAAGMTTYMNIDAPNRHVEIGSTWYRRAVQRTPLNSESKLLLLGHAFEAWDCIAVEFRTHFFNRQSRAAIERLGAKLDGVLRNHQLGRAGTLRDTCCYSILRDEWAAVREHLRHQLSHERDGRVLVRDGP